MTDTAGVLAVETETFQSSGGYNLRSSSGYPVKRRPNVASSSLNNPTSSIISNSSSSSSSSSPNNSRGNSSSTLRPKMQSYTQSSHNLPQHQPKEIGTLGMRQKVLEERIGFSNTCQVGPTDNNNRGNGTSSTTITTTNMKPANRTSPDIHIINDNDVITLNDTAEEIVILEDSLIETDNRRSNNPNTVNDIIYLDTSLDGLGMLGNGSIRGANNNSNGSDTTVTSRSGGVEGISRSSRTVCKVLNCEAEFTSEGSLGQHMNLFQHSPCNPCLLARDCKLAPAPVCFMCPECDREFQTSEACRAHMRSANHLQFYPPLAIAGYMCPQCLYVFPSLHVCAQHIDTLQHNDICYPFAEDQRIKSPSPIPVAEELLQDLKTKSGKVSFSLSCLECLMELPDAAAVRQHMQETNDKHPISVFSNTNLVDLFASYLADFTCNSCRRQYTGQLKEAAKHQCANGVLGTIVENNVQSFQQFIKQCAFTVIKSVDVAANSPGTSYQRSIPGSQYKRSARTADQSELQESYGQSANYRPAKKLCEVPSNNINFKKESPPQIDLTKGQTAASLTGSKADIVSSSSGASVSNTASACDVTAASVGMPTSSQVNQRGTADAQQANKAAEAPSRRDRSRSPLEIVSLSPISTENLTRMQNIIFLDLDNWPGFFSKLPRPLPDLNFIWGFYGGRNIWNEPRRCYVFDEMKRRGLFYRHDRCGYTKDAADFAIVLSVGKMDERLPTNIAFTILSGDKGFCEVERQMKHSARKAVVINPHTAHQFSQDLMYTMVTSVTDT